MKYAVTSSRAKDNQKISASVKRSAGRDMNFNGSQATCSIVFHLSHVVNFVYAQWLKLASLILLNVPSIRDTDYLTFHTTDPAAYSECDPRKLIVHIVRSFDIPSFVSASRLTIP